MPVQRRLQLPLLHQREGVRILDVDVEPTAETTRQHASRLEERTDALQEVSTA